MAEHVAKIIEIRQINDSAVAILARCCGDPSTDSWHTAYDLQNLDTHLVEHPQRVADLHSKTAAHLARAREAGHNIAFNPRIEAPCPHCGAGTLGTRTFSGAAG